jgi:hypothetical protein
MANFEQETHEVPRHLKRVHLDLTALFSYEDPANPNVFSLADKAVSLSGNYLLDVLDVNGNKTKIKNPTGELGGELTPARRQEGIDWINGVLADWEARLAQ